MNPLPFILGLPREVKIAALIVAALVAFQAWRYFDRQDAVEADRAAVEAETAKQALDAERKANAADAERQSEIQANDDATRKAIEDAVAKDPAGTTRAVGPATRAVADRLRNR